MKRVFYASHLALILLFFIIRVNAQSRVNVNSINIGSQIWMSENLNVERFQNGDLIPQAKSPSEWVKYAESGQPAWCYYNYEKANSVKHGNIYNWYAVNDSRGLAPKGYSIPSDADWVTLITYLGGFGSAGQNMKSYDGWGNGSANNLFKAYPSGACNNQGTCYGLGNETGWWSATETSEIFAFRIKLGALNSSVDRIDLLKKFGLSVRCIKAPLAEVASATIKKAKTQNNVSSSNIKNPNSIEGYSLDDLMKLAIRAELTGEKPNLDPSSPFYSKSSSSNPKQTSSTSEKKCSYCWKNQNPIIRYDIVKNQYQQDYGKGEMRPGYIQDIRCKGSGELKEGAFENRKIIRCIDCKGSGWLKCPICNGTGFVK